MDPMSIEVPERWTTLRCVVRRPAAADAPRLHEAVESSFDDLHAWVPWARERGTAQQAEVTCRRLAAEFDLRRDLTMFVFDAAEQRLLGGTGLHRIDWELRKFEIGYWLRVDAQGRGLIGEVVGALTRLAFDKLDARRVEIRMDALNARSRRVAERAGYTFEGTLRRSGLAPDGEARDMHVYARVRGAEEPGRN